jgi:hypothetical protein
MLRVHANEFIALTTRLELVKKLVAETKAKPDRDCKKCWDVVQRELIELLPICRKLKLNGPADKIYRMKAEFDLRDYEYHVLEFALKDLGERIEDDLRSRWFFYVPPEHAQYFDVDPKLFGEAVQNRFPQMTADIVDAGWCLGAERWTAAVYHLIGVVELGIKEVGKHFSIPSGDLEYKDWTRLSNLIEPKIKAMPFITAKDKQDKEAFLAILTHFHGVRGAWRNPTMHSRFRFNQEEAESIFTNVKTFVQIVAMKLP